MSNLRLLPPNQQGLIFPTEIVPLVQSLRQLSPLFPCYPEPLPSPFSLMNNSASCPSSPLSNMEPNQGVKSRPRVASFAIEDILKQSPKAVTTASALPNPQTPTSSTASTPSDTAASYQDLVPTTSTSQEGSDDVDTMEQPSTLSGTLPVIKRKYVTLPVPEEPDCEAVSSFVQDRIKMTATENTKPSVVIRQNGKAVNTVAKSSSEQKAKLSDAGPTGTSTTKSPRKLAEPIAGTRMGPIGPLMLFRRMRLFPSTYAGAELPSKRKTPGVTSQKTPQSESAENRSPPSKTRRRV
ncbi:unnamed protein product, partial [Cylicostephanus goldi]